MPPVLQVMPIFFFFFFWGGGGGGGGGCSICGDTTTLVNIWKDIEQNMFNIENGMTFAFLLFFTRPRLRVIQVCVALDFSFIFADDEFLFIKCEFTAIYHMINSVCFFYQCNELGTYGTSNVAILNLLLFYQRPA